MGSAAVSKAISVELRYRAGTNVSNSPWVVLDRVILTRIKSDWMKTSPVSVTVVLPTIGPWTGLTVLVMLGTLKMVKLSSVVVNCCPLRETCSLTSVVSAKEYAGWGH